MQRDGSFCFLHESLHFRDWQTWVQAVRLSGMGLCTICDERQVGEQACNRTVADADQKAAVRTNAHHPSSSIRNDVAHVSAALIIYSDLQSEWPWVHTRGAER